MAVKRPFRQNLARLLCLMVSSLASEITAFSDDAAPNPPDPMQGVASDLARRVAEVTDTVLRHHIDPPARQQMILEGAKALYRASGQPVPGGLSRTVSAISSSDQIASLFAQIWPKSTAKPKTATELEEAVLRGLIARLPGGAELISSRDRAVMEQFEGNRYVGVHIALGMNDQEMRPVIAGVIEQGPADRAGVKKDDLLEKIDGVDTKKMALREAVDRLRGEEGTSVTITVRQPKEPVARTYTIARGQHSQSTVLGVRKRPAGDWDCMLDAEASIAYFRIPVIAASTPHDLRKRAHELERLGYCGIIIDLRSVGGTSVHPAVLLADTLLPSGVIGRVRKAERELTYQADSDALFREMPIAVLVNQFTSGTAEWIAAALQDNHRALIVGSPTFSAAVATKEGISRRSDQRTIVAVGDGTWSIELVTGYLERGDGRPMSTDAAGAWPGEFPRSPPGDANPGGSQAGVNPDHPVAMPQPRGGRASPSESAKTRDQEPNLAIDPVVQQAVGLLRQALKKVI